MSIQFPAPGISPLQILDNHRNLLTFNPITACDRDLKIYLISEVNPWPSLAQKMLRYEVKVSDEITRAFFKKGA